MEQERKSELWVQSLAELAARRGDSEKVLARAVTLCRSLAISPWIALAVAEGKIRVAEAVDVDRAAKCKQLQAAILDRNLTVARAKQIFPYAPYFLAADLLAQPDSALRRMSEALELATGLLSVERKLDADGLPAPVRGRTLAEYTAAAARIAALRKQHGFDLSTAGQIELGLLDPRIALRKMALQRSETLRRMSRRLPRPGRGGERADRGGYRDDRGGERRGRGDERRGRPSAPRRFAR